MSEQVATLFVLLLGIVTVVAGILWLRLPPFLALLVGAVAVGMATPENIRRDSLSLRSDAAEIERLGGIAAIDDARGPLPKQLATAFGTMCGKIGLLIALAAVIGQAMQASGAADAIVRTVLGLVGQKRAPAALVASGFTIGIPVFFDTVFYLMIPIARSLYQRAGGNYLFYVLCIICGGTMAHSLVPPTPGPLLIAGELRVPLGMMLAAGLFFGLITAVTGYAFASVSTRGSTLTPPVEAAAANESGPLPPFSLSILPIAIPVVLLALGTTVPRDSLLLGYAPWLASLFEKNGAIGIGAVIAVAMLVRFNRTERPWPDLISDSLLSAGMIVLITGAGGAFGEMLQLSGVRQLFATLPEVGSAGLLCLGFFVTSLVRTAQGSSTVAMITAVGLFAGITPEELGCHPVYLAMAIGCGGKPLAWMNDSAFWVMTRMSGMTPGQGLRYITPMTATMAVVGLAAIIATSAVFPMLDGPLVAENGAPDGG